jgi:hypothetical protein
MNAHGTVACRLKPATSDGRRSSGNHRLISPDQHAESVRQHKTEPSLLYWSRLLDWKTQTLTPNTDVIYFTPYFDTKEVGPIVLEIPPADDGAIVGHIMDAWQMPLEDMGVAGIDQGKGGKYLILPPNYSEQVPEGYIVLPSLTYRGYALIRSILRSGSEEDLAKAIEYGKRMKIYPLSQAQNPSPPTFMWMLPESFTMRPFHMTSAFLSPWTASFSTSPGWSVTGL